MTEHHVWVGVHRGRPIAAGLNFGDACEALDIALTGFGGVVHEPWSPDAQEAVWTRYYRNPGSRQSLDAQVIYRLALVGQDAALMLQHHIGFREGSGSEHDRIQTGVLAEQATAVGRRRLRRLGLRRALSIIARDPARWPDD